MLTKILVLALTIHGSIAAPSHGTPVLDALDAHHNVVLQDQSYKAFLPQVVGKEVVLQKSPVHFEASSIGTLKHPIPTGQVLGKHVETYAIGQQNAHGGCPQNSEKTVCHTEKVTPPVTHWETQTKTQSVIVPVQTMQTVQIPSVQYQTVQVPVQIEKEIIEVEKPVPFIQPVPVEPPPKPFVKEVTYARPFQVSQEIVKTRITPIQEVTDVHPVEPKTLSKPNADQHKSSPSLKTPTLFDFTEENLYYAIPKRKVVTRFIKVEEYYEAETTEEVGVFYNYGHTDGDNFELSVTRIFEVDQPILVKNLTTTTKVSTYRSPMHIVKEYVNDKLVFQGSNSSESYWTKLHSNFSKSNDQFKINKYTGLIDGKQVQIEERIYTLPGGHAVFVERRIQDSGDFPVLLENIEPVPSFANMTRGGKRFLVLTLTYDATKTSRQAKHGVPTTGNFDRDFATFLEEFKKFIRPGWSEYDRLKRGFETAEKSSRKKREATEKQSSVSTAEKKEPNQQIQYHGKIYHLENTLVPKDYTPGGFIYKSEDGSEIKVEEETIYRGQGSPRNEYLRFSQVYVPRQKVTYEVSEVYNPPIQPSLGGYCGGYQSFPSCNTMFNNGGFSYKYGNSNHPFYFSP